MDQDFKTHVLNESEKKKDTNEERKRKRIREMKNREKEIQMKKEREKEKMTTIRKGRNKGRPFSHAVVISPSISTLVGI